MKTSGVDLHKDLMTLVVLDESGLLTQHDILPTKCRNCVRVLFASYGTCSQVAVESASFYQWFWKLVGPHVGHLALGQDAASTR